MINYKELLNKIKNNNNIKQTYPIFETLITKTKYVFKNQSKFIKSKPDEIFRFFYKDVTETKVFKILYEKKHNLIQFSHEFNAKHYLIKDIITTYYDKLQIYNSDEFTIFMTSNTQNNQQYDFQINIFEIINNIENITKTYYQLKLRNSTEIPNIFNLISNWRRYLEDDSLTLLLDISLLSLDNQNIFLSLLNQNAYIRYLIYFNRIIFLQDNILTLQDPTILYIMEYSNQIQHLDLITYV